MAKVLVVATSRKTRGGITSVVKAHETGEQWKKYHCRWIETHRDGNAVRKILYFITALIEFMFLVPFYDIVHIHIATYQSAQRKCFFFCIAKLLKKKTILHFHPSNEKFLYEEKVTKLYRYLFEKSDKVWVLSPQWNRWICDILGSGPWCANIEVKYNPCPVVCRNESMRTKQILYAGTILRRKGYDVLLRAFGKIACQFPDWTLVFAGNAYHENGEDEIAKGIALSEELRISDQVRWLGWVSGKEKDKVFNESSIYCLASDGEGFPMGVLDAWAYGIPCVVTPVGGIPDIIDNGVNGLLFNVGDVSQLADCLVSLMSDENLRKSIVHNSDKLANGLFDISVVNESIGNGYLAVLSGQ